VEAAIVNTLLPGDKVLMAETGQFRRAVARQSPKNSKLDVDFVPGDWRRGADVEQIEARLAADRQHRIKAVMVVHNETSTGCVTHPLEVRKAIGPDKTSGAADGRYYFRRRFAGIRARRLGHRRVGRRFAKGADAAAGPQLSTRCRKRRWRWPRPIRQCGRIWDWQEVIAFNKVGTWPYTPAVNLLYGLKESHLDARARGARQCLLPATSATVQRRAQR